MKLYFKPLACSLAVHIAARELGVSLDLIRVTEDSPDRDNYRKIHPLGAVPSLILDDGTVLTETSVILQYLAASVDVPMLAPRPKDADYWHFLQMLNFIATDVQKGFGPLFFPSTPDAMKESWRPRLEKRIAYLSTLLDNRSFLLDRGYSIADIYLYVMLLWCRYVAIDIKKWPALARYFEALENRPAIAAALEEERRHM